MPRLRTLRPLVATADMSIAKLPPKVADPFYGSREWAEIKAAVRRRSGGICEVQGCTGKAIVCDHIRSRRQGGADDPSNCRDLCRAHDNRWKEDHMGQRRGRPT